MNVWAIDKDMPLKLLLLELVHRYGENTLALNTQEQHYQAIDLCTLDDPSLSAYIYTFGQSTGRYGIDLRYPISAHNIVGENENLTLDQIIEIISTHLFCNNILHIMNPRTTHRVSLFRQLQRHQTPAKAGQRNN